MRFWGYTSILLQFEFAHIYFSSLLFLEAKDSHFESLAGENLERLLSSANLACIYYQNLDD
jgi:hypothetical protein